MIDWHPQQRRDGQAYLTFSQREGYASLPEPLRLEELSNALRAELWDIVAISIKPFHQRSIIKGGERDSGEINLKSPMKEYMQRVYAQMHHIPLDSVPHDHKLYYIYREIILQSAFNEVFDLIERFADLVAQSRRYYFAHAVQNLMARHAAAYHFTSDKWPLPPYRFEPHSSQRAAEVTLNALQSAKESGLQGVAKHLDQAGSYLSDSRWADSVRESIHAIESVVLEITSARSLSKGLSILTSQGYKIHPALQEGLLKLYGYASNEPGIRHSLDATQDEPSVGQPEAMFIYATSAAFVDYFLQSTRGNS